jgi:hypothetical protein
VRGYYQPLLFSVMSPLPRVSFHTSLKPRGEVRIDSSSACASVFPVRRTLLSDNVKMASHLIRKPLPAFSNVAVMPDQEFKTLTNEDFKGSWTVLFSYPLDFTCEYLYY